MSWVCLISFLSCPWCVIVRFNLMPSIVFKRYRIDITKLSKSKSLLKREDSSNTLLATTTLLGAVLNYVDNFWSFFDHLPSSVDIFYLINVFKKSTFHQRPPAPVSIVCERSLALSGLSPNTMHK